ncbi:conserved membrane hypothetical protein [Sphingomonas sp. EC-HK361]|uniref:hypothetical protein n=1 Tax=Sphingomonas sp. EC-HK361 TaxID=2038397 RepID=UPI00125B3A07|nr:hypothetical protein [Sphingomonas sp. EC-HK361]VVT04909.1 conserved membrane hypothetical protein [Sphingomonas sp. EC-HK361]
MHGTITTSRARARTSALVVAAIVAVAFALRATTLARPSIHHPDEIYQYLEAAHRYLFGYGVVPWEYRVGMRSWLLPLLLSGPMALGNLIAPGGTIYLLLPRLAMIAASTTIVGSAWTLGARVSRTHAICAAIVAATWYEFIALAAHPLGETTGLASACAAAALAFGGRQDAKRMAAAGALLALTCVLRFQYGPAVLVLAAFAGGRDRRGRWLPMAAGGAAMLVVSAAVDLAFGAVPFFWLLENVRQNIVLDKAAGFGTSPVTAYIGVLGNMWSWASVPIVIAAYIGGRRFPALFWAAVVHFALHSLIAHKEFRFILLTSGFAIILAAIGTVDLIDRLAARVGRPRRVVLLSVSMIVWIAVSILLGARWERRPLWTARSASLATFTDLRRDPALCGIGLIGVPISEFGGYTVLHRQIPIYMIDRRYPRQRQAAAAFAPAYDSIIVTSMRAGDVPAGFTRAGCRSTAGEYIGNYTNPQDAGSISAICLYRRPGRCDARTQRQATPLEVNRVLADLGM